MARGVAGAVAEWRDGTRRADLLDELLSHPLDPGARSALTDLAERPDRAIELWADQGWARTQLAELARARDERTARGIAEALLEGRRGITRDQAVSELLRITRTPAEELSDDDFRRVAALTWLPPQSKPAVPAHSASHPLMNAYAHSLHPARHADTARDLANLHVANRAPDAGGVGMLDELAHQPPSNTRAQNLRALARSEHASSAAAGDGWRAERLHVLANTWNDDTTRAIADAVLEARGGITAAEAAREMVAITGKPRAHVTVDDYRRAVTLSMLPEHVAPTIPKLSYPNLLHSLEHQRLPGRDIFRALDFADIWAANAPLRDSQSATRVLHEMLMGADGRDLHLRALVRRSGDLIDEQTFAHPAWARTRLDDIALAETASADGAKEFRLTLQSMRLVELEAMGTPASLQRAAALRTTLETDADMWQLLSVARRLPNRAERLAQTARAAVAGESELTRLDAALLQGATAGELRSVGLGPAAHARLQAWLASAEPAVANLTSAKYFLERSVEELQRLRSVRGLSEGASGQLLEETQRLVDVNVSRLAGKTPAGEVVGWLSHPDYAEIGRIGSNLRTLDLLAAPTQKVATRDSALLRW